MAKSKHKSNDTHILRVIIHAIEENELKYQRILTFLPLFCLKYVVISIKALYIYKLLFRQLIKVIEIALFCKCLNNNSSTVLFSVTQEMIVHFIVWRLLKMSNFQLNSTLIACKATFTEHACLHTSVKNTRTCPTILVLV